MKKFNIIKGFNKKIYNLVLLCVVVFSCVACGDEKNNNDVNQNAQSYSILDDNDDTTNTAMEEEYDSASDSQMYEDIDDKSNLTNHMYSGGDEHLNDNSEEGTCSHGSCEKKRVSGSRYCRSHTCIATGCYSEVSAANERCSKHKKEYYDDLGIGDKEDVPNCVEYGCDTDAYKDSKYCISHKCRQNGCNNGQWGGNKYCYEHCPH